MNLGSWDNDWQFMDGIKTGTIRPRNPVGADVAGAKYRENKLNFTMQQLIASGTLRGLTKSITTWPSTAGGYVLQERDQFVTDDGQVWVVALATVTPIGGNDYLLNQVQ